MNRKLNMLRYLVQSNSFTKIGELATVFNVTTRTVRNDLLVIEEYLKGTKAELVKKKGHGVIINKENITEEDLIRLIKKVSGEKSFYLEEERLNIILQELFINEEPLTLNILSERTKSSRSTVIKDLAKCEKWLNYRNLFLKKKPHYGTKLVYKEHDWRMGVIDHINNNLKEFNFQKLCNSFEEKFCYSFDSNVNEFINHFTCSKFLILIKNFIRKYESDQQIRFTDDAFINIFLYICIATKRIKDEKILNIDSFEQGNIVNIETIANWIKNNSKIIDFDSSINFIEVEINYMACYMLSQNVRYSINGLFNSNGEAKKLVEKFLDKVQEVLCIDLSDDSVLFNSLLLHINTTINRLLFDVQVKNPLIEEIKFMYPHIFRACSIAAEQSGNMSR